MYISMQEAIKAVHEGKMSINRAAMEHAVPPTTLKDRLSGRVKHGTKPGPKPYLSLKEEVELVHFLVNCSKMGYGKTRRQVLQMVKEIVIKKGVTIKKHVSNGWFRRFKSRFSVLTLRKGDAYASIRADCTNREKFENYFLLLKEVLDKHDLEHKPGQIYNCDESGMPFDARPLNVVTSKKLKKVRSRTSSNKSQTTILACANTAGQAKPPMVIFDLKNLQQPLTEEEVPGMCFVINLSSNKEHTVMIIVIVITLLGTLYGLSDKGWIQAGLFHGWLTQHFVKYATSERPILLLLDGHSSHYQPDVVRYAQDHGIIMFTLPPHTTADSQPMNVGCFGPLKKHWHEISLSIFYTFR